MRFTDPSLFEDFITPAAGELRVRPMTGSGFRADLDVRALKGVTLFTVEAGSFMVQKSPQQESYTLNIPLGAPLTISESGKDQHYGFTDAHMLSPGRPLTAKCKDKCDAMACSILVDSITTYRERMLQEATSMEQTLEPHVFLMSAAGNQIFRSVIRAWVALGEGGSPVSDIVIREMEDDLLASFLSIAEGPHVSKQRVGLPISRTMKNIEDYICANLDKAITRDDLADETGVPIRSLSRAFNKKYGLGPMAFVYQRRLDACYKHLHGSEPGTTTVTRVAMSHGFEHLGRFSIAYKDTFGESPSETLFN